MAQKYDPEAFHHHSNIFVRYIERKRVHTILRLLNISRSEYDPIIEVGCGAGNILEIVPKGKLFGTDISTFLLSKASRRLQGKVYLFQGDAENLPCKDGVFAQVICSEVLEHVLDPLAVLQEIARILKASQFAIISIPNERWINRIKKVLLRLGLFHWLVHRRGEYREMPERMEDEWHLHSLQLREWLILFKKSFRVTHLKRIPFIWVPLRYVVRLEKLP